MTKLKYIEDYMQFIAGYTDKNGKVISWFASKAPISLASYDVKFVDSVSEQIAQGKALTDRQAVLAEKIIVTYERQLRKLGVDQPDKKEYKLGQRTVDRSSSLVRKDDLLMIRFPFNEQMIASVKEFAKNAQGRVFWSKDDRAWCTAITEFNVSWLVAYASANHISVDAEVKEMFDRIIEVEETPFAIELKIDENGKPFISNAPDSLREYVEAYIGFDDLYALVDSAGVLGFTISEEISQVMDQNHSRAFTKLCSGRVIDLSPSEHKYSIDEVVEWAVTVNRLPIVVFNPNFLTPKIDEYKKYFSESEISVVSHRTGALPITVDPSIKLVYTNTVLEWSARLPLLISYANLMHSTSKKGFMSKAEKIVYLCEALPKR